MSSKSPESKLIKALRAILSFFLSGIIVLLSLAICFNADFLDEKVVEKRLTSYEYTCGVRDNITDFVKHIYNKNGLQDDNIYDIVNYSAVNTIVKNYAGCYITSRIGYDDDAYVKSIDEIVSALKEDITNQVGAENKKQIDDVGNLILEYFVDEIQLNSIEYLKTLLNIGTPVSYVVIGVSVFFFIFITLILLFLSEKRYRSIRAISISFLTAGMFEFCLAGIVYIISQVRRFDIYPIYLYDEFMKYINTCIGVVVISGFASLVVSVAVSVIVWINKTKVKR